MSHRRRHGEINVSSPWTWISVVPSPGMKFNNRDIPPDTHLCFPSLFSLPTWGPAFLHRRRIQKHLASLSTDDALLVKEDLGSHLKDEELVEALEERGLWVFRFWVT